MSNDLVGKTATTSVKPEFTSRVSGFAQPTRDARQDGATVRVTANAGGGLFFTQQGEEGTLSVYHASELTPVQS